MEKMDFSGKPAWENVTLKDAKMKLRTPTQTKGSTGYVDLAETIIDKVMEFLKSLMEMLGIKFAPWTVPRGRRLQTLAAAGWISLMLCGELLSMVLFVLIIRTDYYWIMVLYAIIIARNRDNCNFGAKSWSWVRNWSWWQYFRDYFPMKLVKTHELDPSRNYLLCVFPHGVLCTGTFGSFATEALGFSEIFPGMTPHMLTLGGHFMVPFFRELISWLGMCSVSAQSISYLLDRKKETGRCAVLLVGGAAESLNCHSGEYRVVLKNRRGFVRLALQNGAPLVPVISFGEVELYEQVTNPAGSRVRRVQEWVKHVTGIAPVMPLGRGVLQYSVGVVPQRHPVVTVVGKPIEVELNLTPSPEQIDRLHAEFTKELIDMFEREKHKYITNAKATHLIID